jgi:sporulation protein YlmC with PRC-barrel domain
MSKNERLRRDIAGVGPEPRRAGLHPLSGLKEFRIGKGEPDIRGWEVRTLNGREVGRVDDLLVDTDAGEVVMMDVEMRGSERHIELPIRSAQIDHHASHVLVDSGDVELYAGRFADDGRLAPDRDERGLIDRDRHGLPDRDIGEDELARRLREQERGADAETVDRYTRLRGRDADAVERDQLAAEAQSEADEVVVERPPVIEEVVVRRKVIDTD